MTELVSWLVEYEALAGWVQTLGSIVALSVAIALPGIQRRGLERAALSLAAIQVQMMLIALELALMNVLSEDEEEAQAYSYKHVAAAMQSVSAIELWRLSSADALLVQQVTLMFQGFERIWSGARSEPGMSDLDDAESMVGLAEAIVGGVASLTLSHKRHFVEAAELSTAVINECKRIRSGIAATRKAAAP